MNFPTLGRIAVRYRWFVIVLYLAVAAFFAVQIPQTEFDPDIKSMIPPGVESLVNYERIEELFGGTEFVMVGLQSETILSENTLRRIDDITWDLELVDGIDTVMSLTTVKDIRGDDGMMIVEPLVPWIPDSPEEIAALEERIRGSDLFYGSLVSRDLSATVVLAFVSESADDELITTEINRIIAEHPGPERIYIGGLPPIRATAAEAMQTDMARFVPVGLLIMIAFLYLSFRQLRAVVLPFVIVVLSIMVAMGSISLLGWRIQLVTVVLPVILIAIANDYGIHLVSRYQDMVNVAKSNDSTLSAAELGSGVIAHLGAPVLAAGITTIIGFFSLTTHLILPARQLGVLAAIGILYALVGSLTFIPAVLSLLPVAAPPPAVRDRSPATLILRAITRAVVRRPRGWFYGSVAAFLLISSGMMLLIVDTNPINFFTRTSEVYQANAFLERSFGGTTSIQAVVEGDIQHPETMRAIEFLERELEARDAVGDVTAVSRVVRRMNTVLHDNDPAFDRIPDDRDAIAQYFLLYSFGGDPQDFEKLVDFDFRRALITARINDTRTNLIQGEMDHLAALRVEIETQVGTLPPEDAPRITVTGGFAAVLTEIASAIVFGQMRSLIVAIVLVGIVVMILFRSLRAGLMTMLPLALAVTTLLGLMGITGVELNTVTAMLTSVMIGVGVDYTIHFLAAYRRLSTTGGTDAIQGADAAAPVVPAVTGALELSGRAIFYNAMSVMVGFMVLLGSGFLPVRFFGFLVVVSIASCLYTALVFLPAAIMIKGARDEQR